MLATLVAIVDLSIAPAARASDRPAVLNDVAHVYSLGVGEVRCPSQTEWDADRRRASFSWGYTNVRKDYSVLPPMICAGAMNVGSIGGRELDLRSGPGERIPGHPLLQ